MATSLDDLMDQYTQPTERNPESKGGLASLMDSQVRYEKEQLAASVTSAREISPDEVLRRKQTSRALGVPEGVVKGDPETAARMAEVERVDRETADTPAVRQQYTDADFAALAKGPETGILAQIERKAKSLAAAVAGFGGSLAGGMRTMAEMGRRDYTERVNELYNLLPEEKKARLVDAGVAKKTATGSLESVDDFKSDIVDWALERGERLKAVADELRPEDQTFVEQTIEGLGQLAAQVGLMALTRGGSAAMMFTMGVDQAAEKIKRDKVAQKADRDLQDLEILTGGLIIGATEWLAGKFQLGKLQSKLLANTLVKRLLSITEGGVVEGGQELMENLLNDVAHIAMTNPESKVGVMEALQAGKVGTAVGAVFQSLVQGALHIRGKRLQNTLASLSESAKLSDLRQKDPTTFQNVAEAIAGHLAQTSDGPVEDIYLDSMAFAQVALKAGVDPAEVAAELGVADQLEQAASAGGGDLVLPLQTVIGKIAGSELGDALIPHLRSGQDSLSISERETSAKMAGAWAERLTKAEEEITLTADQRKEFNRSATVVRQTFQAQLDKAGKYNPSQNRAMAAFLTAVYSNIARRRKEFTTPEQLYAMFPYKMEAGTQAGSSLAGVLQVSPEEATAMAATARKWGGRQKVYRAVESIVRQGDSVLDYGSGKLMEGRAAVVDRGGEYTPHDPYQGIQGDLSRAYDVVMASNVLNVQTKAEDAEGEYNRVLDELSGRVSETGTLVVNMPTSGPRADWMSPARLEADLKTRFKNVTRQGEVVYASNAEPRVPGQPWEKFDQVMTDADTMAEKIAAALTVEGPASPDSEVALPPHPEFAQLHPESIAEWEKRTTAWMKRQGYAPDEIAKHLSAMRGQLKIFAALGPVELELLPRSAGKSKMGPIRENSDVIYKLSFDASAMCVRRLEASATAAAIETKIGRSLTPSERMALVVLFQQAGKMAPCLYCYVEAPRAKMAEFAQRAVDVVLGNRAITEKWSAKTKGQAQEAIAEAKAKGLEKIDVNLVVDPVYQAAHPEETARLAEETPKVWDFVRSMMLAAKANLPKLYEEYAGQILGIKQEVIEELNGYAGFRFFSSSDFQAEHVADLMQAIIDLELRKAKAHAYTKVVSFVEIFGRTGMKIQTSIFARESKDGVITPDTDQGMDWEEAKRLRKKFSNVGSVFVAASDAQLKWAMEQDWIDYIIPFHFSGMASAFYETLGYQDFTSTQTEAPIKKGEKAKKIRMHEITQGGKISDKEATRRYLTLAMERGLYPVFPAAMFKDFEPVVRTGDAKKDKAARRKQNKAAREEWRKMVEAGKIDWSRINMNYFKVKKDYARTDTPFEPVQAKFDRAKASEKMNSFLEGNEPRAVVDETITEQFLRLQEMHGDAMGIEALKARRENETFFAQMEQAQGGKTARATFDPATLTTTLLEAADVSSFFHEGAHLFLEMYSTLAAYPNADETTKRDMQTLLEWFKIPDLDTWNRMSMLDRKPYHEQFAYNFETFIAEGKAPSPAMGRMFDRFKKWLTDAYKDIRASVNQIYKKEFGKDLPILTNEVRQVMERMISSDAQIERAQRARAMVPLFMTQSEALALGLTFTDDEWDAYRELHDDATNAATSELRAAYMQDMKWLTGAKSRALSALQRQTAATRKVVRAKVAKEVQARRIYQAEDALKKAKASGDPMAVAAVVDAYGPSPDEQGWPSQELLEAAIAAAPKQENVIEALTDQRMLEKHGEMMDPAQIEEATNRAVYNELRGRVLAAEFRALAKAEPPVRVLEDAARNLARLMVGKLTLPNLKASRYSRAEVRAGKMAMEAAKKGDIEATMDAKHTQLIHHMATREVHRAKEQIKKAEKTFKKVFTTDARLSKGYDMNYVGVARAILAQYGFGKADKTADAHLELIRRYEPEFYAEIEPMITAHKVAGKTLKDLTVDEFVDLAEQIEGLWHLARRTRQSLIDGKLVDRKAIVAELADRVRELTKPGARPGEKRAATDWEKTKVQLLGAKAAMRRVESWVDFMDGKNPRGPFRRYIWEPISEAATRYRLEKVKYLSQYRDILAKYSDLMTGKELNFDGRYTFTSQEFLHALLHTGNKSNKTKLLVGREWGTVDLDTGVLDSTKWDAFVQANVTERQMDFCQEIWDLMESTKPAAQKAHKEMYGFFFGEITAEPVTIMVDGKPKTYRGGYVPAVTDPMQVTDAAINKEKEDAQGNNSYMFPTTGRGFTKQRIETYTKPLLLDLGYLHVHIDKVLRFSHLEPRIKDVGRVVKSNRAFGEALDRYDPTLRKDMLIPWLQRTATQLAAMPSEGEGGKLLDRLASWARRSAGMQIMVGNVTNTMQQFTGLFIAMAKVRPRHLRNGTWRVMRQPKRTIAEIEAKSPFMRTRITESQYEIQSTINKLLLDPNPYQKLQQWFVEHGYVLQQFTQGFVDCSTWVGAYEQAVEQGHSEDDAVRAADEAVRLTQGSFNPEDASRLETGHPFVRLFSQFMSYFNMQANILGTEFGKAVHDLGGVERMGRLLYVYAFAFMAPAVVSEIIVQALSGFDDGDDDEYDVTDAMRLFFGSQARTALAMAPGVGPTITSGVAAWNKNPMDDRIRASAAITTLEAAVRAPHAVYKAIAEEGNWKTGARDFLTLLGLISGLPLGQLGKPVGYALAVKQGKAEPESVGDVARGLVSGQDVNRETN
jgi:hypothetical protein